MTRGVKLGISILIAAILSGIYWIGFLLLLFSWTAADYGPGAEPPDPAFKRVTTIAALIAAPIVYGLLIWLWRRIVRTELGER